jgi:hypothetical protein
MGEGGKGAVIRLAGSWRVGGAESGARKVWAAERCGVVSEDGTEMM